MLLVFAAVSLLSFDDNAKGPELAVGGTAAEAGGDPVVIEASFPGTLSSHPRDHHRAENMRDAQTGEYADWAADYAVDAGTPVRSRLNGPYGTTLTVLAVVPSCGGGGGGTAVKVGVRAPNGGPELGWAAYLHLADVAVAEGQTVYPDTVLGVVGDGFVVDEACWTGPHLHVEGFNRDEYSCYYAPSSVGEGTALGRVGGSDVSAAQQPCP